MILQKLLSYLKRTTIYRDDNSRYLTRYYIFRKPLKWLPSIYIHQFHNGDKDLELHSHPWSLSLSFILKGSYLEEYRIGNKVFSRIKNPGNFNLISKDRFHRVDLITNEVWTLFISGPKVGSWGFWNRDTGEYWDWTEHEKRRALRQAKPESPEDILKQIERTYGQS